MYYPQYLDDFKNGKRGIYISNKKDYLAFKRYLEYLGMDYLVDESPTFDDWVSNAQDSLTEENKAVISLDNFSFIIFFYDKTNDSLYCRTNEHWDLEKKEFNFWNDKFILIDDIELFLKLKHLSVTSLDYTNIPELKGKTYIFSTMNKNENAYKMALDIYGAKQLEENMFRNGIVPDYIFYEKGDCEYKGHFSYTCINCPNKTSCDVLTKCLNLSKKYNQNNLPNKCKILDIEIMS